MTAASQISNHGTTSGEITAVPYRNHVANVLANPEDGLGLLQNDFCFAVLPGTVEGFAFVAELDDLRSLCRRNFCCRQRRIDFLDILRMFRLRHCNVRQYEQGGYDQPSKSHLRLP